MASIEKRGDYTYRITVSNGYDRNGKKIVEKRTVTLDASLTPKQLEKELQRRAVEFENEVKKGSVIDSAITFEKFTQKWLTEYAEKRLEKTTIESYKGELNNKILPAIGHIKLCDLKPLHLIKFYDNLTEDGVRIDGKPGGYSTRIIKYQHQIISSILQTAVYWQIINENIAKKVRPPKGIECKKGDNYFDEIQTKNFFKFVIETQPLIYQAIVLVTAYGGLRKGELLGLEWSDIDFDNNTININKALTRAKNEVFIKGTKNKSSTRIIAVPNIVTDILHKLKENTTSNYIFPMDYGTPSHWFRRTIENYNKIHDDKLPNDITFHGLRHTSATLLIMQGLDIKTVSARLGHKDTTTTLNIYAHAIKSQDRAASDALANVLDLETT